MVDAVKHTRGVPVAPRHACLWDTTASRTGGRWWVVCAHPDCDYGARGEWLSGTALSEVKYFGMACALADAHETIHNRPGGTQ